MEKYDVVIVGAGPAGMTAGVFATRKGLNTVIVSRDIGGQVNWTTDIENYMGFEEIDGQALMNKFQAQVKDHQLQEKQADVRHLKKEAGLFIIETDQNEKIASDAVIICSGKKPKTLNVPGEEEYRNKGVSYCSTCDGPLFRGVPVAVVGGGNSAAKSALDLANYATEIHLISLTPLTADAILVERLRNQSKIKQYIEYAVKEIRGTKAVDRILVEELKTKNQFEIPVQGVFIEIGLDPNTAFIDASVELNEAREIKVDCLCRTNIPGLFAAGDVSSVPEKQIIIAAGEGAKAAIKAWEYLISLPQSTVKH